ncbi:hypothetical protein [Mesorhizobium sp.]|uniref:hypothetical protein n=1 Tax=Mesorhizobium sp. TaxID=1871066 RepID=UPI000FE7A62F|nr:hypothetical protein [Mesorhizobium sp.]RWH32481.1 MAG: hypothetical protein EOQ76_03140 [Mesorhizobium sp.]RWH41196.1 MAG: hypothetical protein EOQ79_02170 [Mesorhizobium sp.]TIM67622.1 MAG: hypothetical protein E5Y52_11105 [Mesorhizobium sp.]TIQ93047.1 MAG: hypothetical protein E5X36_31570 [Mesorhizobium sp.]TIR61851.1 MAG: hypothetical protein E5X22_03440 [Mesorhizobium sp.]
MADKVEKADKSDEPAVVDTQTGIFPRFRQLWNGGEHRNAVNLAKAENLSEVEWAALLDEFPGIVDVINQ